MIVIGVQDCYFPEVVQSVPGEDSSVYAYFSDGTIHLCDASGLLEDGGVFEPLCDPEFFRGALTVGLMRGSASRPSKRAARETNRVPLGSA